MKIPIIVILIVSIITTSEAFMGAGGGRIVKERNKRRKEEQSRQYKYDVIHHPEKTMCPVNPIDYKSLVNPLIRHKMSKPHEWILVWIANYIICMTFACIFMFCCTNIITFDAD